MFVLIDFTVHWKLIFKMSDWSITKFLRNRDQKQNLLFIFPGTYFDIAETEKGIFRNAWFRDLTKKI